MSNLPNANIHLDNVSRQLRRYPRWIVYRLVAGIDKLKKVPYCWRDLSIGEVNAYNPANHGTFDQCRAAAGAGGSEFGVGIVLGEGITVADIDYREVTDVDALKRNVAMLREHFPTLHEMSVSGGGEHLYYFGMMPEGWLLSRPGITFYDGVANGARFIAVTGNGMSPDDTIAFGGDAFTMLGRSNGVAAPSPVAYNAIEYGDKEALIDEASKFVKGGGGLRPLLNTPITYPGPGNWSGTLGTIVLALASARADKLTAYRILELSPFVTQSTPRDNETRPAKLHRLFYHAKRREWERAVECAERAGRVSNGLDRVTVPDGAFAKREGAAS